MECFALLILRDRKKQFRVIFGQQKIYKLIVKGSSLFCDEKIFWKKKVFLRKIYHTPTTLNSHLNC